MSNLSSYNKSSGKRSENSLSNNAELTLHGDKIKLESRPLSSQSASSKCAYLLQGPSRPVSAVPMLNLYHKGDECDLKGLGTRRPYSADNLRTLSRNKGKELICSSSSLQSIEELDNDLPSTELLKSLIGEPIISWRGLQQVSNSFEVNNSETIDSMAMTPGIKGKPPLPIMGQQQQQQRRFEKYEAKSCLEEDWLDCAELKTDITLGKINEASSLSFDRKNICDSDLIRDKALLMFEDNQRQSFTKGLDKNDLDNEEFTLKNRKLKQTNEEFTFKNNEFHELQELLSTEDLKDIKSEKEKDNFEKQKDNFEIQKDNLEKQKDNFEKQKGPIITITDCSQTDDLDLKRAKELIENTASINVGNANVTFEQFFGDFVSETSALRVEKVEILKQPDKQVKTFSKTLKNEKPEVKPKPQILKKQPADKNKTLDKNKFLAKPIKSFKDFDERSGNKVTLREVEDISWMSTRNDHEQSCIDNSESKREKEKETNKIEEDWDSDGGTCKEIEAILEVLEQESAKSHNSIESIKKIVTSELNTAINSIGGSKPVGKEHVKDKEILSHQEDKLSVVSVQSSDDSKETSKSTLSIDSRGSHSNNFNEILSFLDEVDRNSAQSLTNSQEQVLPANHVLRGCAIRLDTIPKLDDLLQYTPVELANQIIELNLRVKDKSSSIKMLQDELSGLREQVMRTQRQTDRIVKEKLKAQKDEADLIVKRHQKFVDQLMADKKSLSDRCTSLVEEMKVLEERCASNIRAMEHKYKLELKKAKDMHLAGEKIRRDRWIDTKTQKIKELTVRSIEPELQAMTVRHEQELSDLRSLHKREIEEIEMKNARKSQQLCESLRAQLSEEREKALAHERELMRMRYESMMQTEEKSYQEQRKRLQQEQANRIAECEEREALVLADKEKAIKQVREECEERIKLFLRRQENELKIQNDQVALELEGWKSSWRKQQELALNRKEQIIRDQCRKERDREIECVIERLDAEATESKKQLDVATENRIRRIKEKYESEIKELETSERESQAKYVACKSKVQELEESLSNLQITCKKIQSQLHNTSEAYEKLAAEKENLREIVRDEMRSEMAALEQELQRVKSDRDTELQQVYGRVKVAVARKDEMLSELNRDHGALKEKCKYLENMLEQQRKDFLIK